MVETTLIHKILKRLEKYLIRKNDFHISGDTYDLILFIPSDKYHSDTKYSLLISAKRLDYLSQKEVIKELLFDFKDILSFEEYNALSRLNIINSNDPFVKNLKFLFPFREELIEIKDIPVGGVNLDFAYLVKSLVLDKLIEGNAVSLGIIKQENKIDLISAGIIRIDKNFDVVIYTGKGLLELWKPDMTEKERINAYALINKSEEYLIENYFIAKVKLDNISRVI